MRYTRREMMTGDIKLFRQFVLFLKHIIRVKTRDQVTSEDQKQHPPSAVEKKKRKKKNIQVLDNGEVGRCIRVYRASQV